MKGETRLPAYFCGKGGGDFTEPIPNLYVVRVSAPGVILGQVEDELRSHGVAALRHAEHVEGGRVGERHVAQLRAGDVHAPRGICGRKEEEAYLCANLRRLFALYNTHLPSIIFSLSIAQFFLLPLALPLSDEFPDNCGPLCPAASLPTLDSLLVPSCKELCGELCGGPAI